MQKVAKKTSVGDRSFGLMWLEPRDTLTPILIKHAAALAALIRLSAHRVINGHGQEFTTVWALHFRGAGDGSREAEFVVDEVVEEER